eukprot:9021880-Alexandrium_andersonii.AAC.1
MICLEQDPMMVSEPTNAGDGLNHSAIVQASRAQHRMRQDRPRIAILDDQDGQGRVAGVFGKEAMIHCDLRHVMCTSGGTRARQIGHSA